MLSTTLLSVFHRSNQHQRNPKLFAFSVKSFHFPREKPLAEYVPVTNLFPSFIQFIKSQLLKIILNANEISIFSTQVHGLNRSAVETYWVMFDDGSSAIKRSPIGWIFKILRLYMDLDGVKRMTNDDSSASCKLFLELEKLAHSNTYRQYNQR